MIKLAFTYTALVLIIPIVLVWKVRVSWKRKVALASTLCLTVVMIIITIARMAGFTYKHKQLALPVSAATIQLDPTSVATIFTWPHRDQTCFHDNVPVSQLPLRAVIQFYNLRGACLLVPVPTVEMEQGTRQ